MRIIKWNEARGKYARVVVQDGEVKRSATRDIENILASWSVYAQYMKAYNINGKVNA
jgi:hypothetical protein